MWDIRSDMKREAQSKNKDKLQLQKLKDKFSGHPMHEAYVEHVRSEEGRRLYREMLNG